MNHNEEMKMLTLMGDISKSLKKIAASLEKEADNSTKTCATCVYETASEIDENGVEYDPCHECDRNLSKWKSRRSCT